MHITEISSQNIWAVIKSHKRYVVVAGALVIAVILWLFYSSSASTQQITAADIYTVGTGNIESSIKVLWTTKITNQQKLTFQAAGWLGSVSKVTNLYVKEGDTVKAWQLLAEIDKKNLTTQLSQQALSVQNARLNYDKLINQYTDADKIQAQKNVDDMKTKLDIAKKGLATLIAEQWNTVPLNSTTIQNILIAIRNDISKGKDILRDIDQKFYITKSDPLYANAQQNLSAKNTAEKSITETYFFQSQNSLGQLESALSLINWQTTVELTAIKNIQNQTRDFLNVLSTLTNAAINATKDSIVDARFLSQSTMDSWISSFSSENTSTLSMLSSINSDIASLTNSATDVQTKQNEVNNDQAQLQIYQDTLQTITNGPKSSDKQLQANSIAQSSLSYQQLSQQKDNYEIRAPFDGTVNTIDFKQGDNVDNTQWITISNPNNYEIDMLIDQIDIVKIQQGQPVEITFDAYPGHIITWAVSNIDPTPIVSAGVTSYQAKIMLQKTDNRTIYDSMSTNIKVIIDHKEDVILVPTIALQTRWSQSYVQTRNGLTVNNAFVAAGISDGVNTEVMSWLQIGENILFKQYTVQKAATAPSIFTQSSWQAAQRNQFRQLQGN